MDGGAWNSGIFDTGRDGHKARAPSAHAAMESGDTPPMYNPTLTAAAKDSSQWGILVVTLRSLLIVTSLIALAVMASSKQEDYESIYKFTKIESFVGLVSLCAIVCFYALVQLVLCVVQFSTTGSFVSSATSVGSLLTFILDSVLSYALMGAAAAAADSQAVYRKYEICSTSLGSKFCSKTQASVGISFLAFVSLAVCAVLFPVRLYMLRQ